MAAGCFEPSGRCALWNDLRAERKRCYLARMAFIITAGPDAQAQGLLRVKKHTRKDAMETADGLAKDGFQQIAITDETTGRVFTPTEFRSTLDD